MNDVLTLLWKEYRTNAHLIVIGCSILFLPVLLAISMTSANSNDANISEIVAVGMIFGSVASLVVSQVMMICLGGFLVGGERSARTFEFLFNQPVSRFKIVISKLLFALAWIVAVWLLGLLMMLVGWQSLEAGNAPNLEGLGFEFFIDVGAVGVMLFATCWLASNIFDGSVLAMAVGSVATAFTFLLIQMITKNVGSVLEFEDYDWTRIVVFTILSLALTAAGAKRFVDRKAP